MKSIRQWLNKYRCKCWFSALLNLILLALILLILVPVFETNDDSTMYLMTGGAKGRYDAHLLFINILIGRLCVGLYSLFPHVQWYSILQYAVIFASFTAIFYVLQNRLKPRMASAVFGILYCYFGYECYIILQFSKTAGIAACAGILLMFYGLEQERSNARKTRLIIISGMLLALLGSMYRFKEFLLCAGVMSGIGVYALLCIKHGRRIFPYLCSFGLLFLLAAGLYQYDLHSYAKDPKWEEYRSYNDLRSNLMDYRFPDYDTYREVYERLGISREDQALYRSGNYADPELFDREVIETLTEYCTNRTINRQFVTDYFARFPVGFLKIYVFTCFLLCFMFWLFYGRKGKREIAALFYETAMVGLVYAYLFYMGRSLISRTETTLWLAASLFLLWLLDGTKESFSAQTSAVFIGFALIFNLRMWQPNFRFSADNKESRQITAGEREFQETLAKDTGHLYLSKIGTLTSFLAYEPFSVIPSGLAENTCTLGGWEYGNPINDEILARYNVTNPYRDMLDNQKVIVIDDKIRTTLNYLQTNYTETAQADLIKTAGGRKFYSLRSMPLKLDTENLQTAENLVCESNIAWNKKDLTVNGILYQPNTDSFRQRVYLRITDTENGEIQYFNAATSLAEGKTELDQGLYGRFECQINLKQAGLNPDGNYEIDLILENENGWFYRSI